jgi:hypothetical protein
MKGLLSKYFSKFFIQQWIIGITRADIKDIIRNKTFNPDIKWFPIQSKSDFSADPFVYKTKEGGYDILLEDYSFKDCCGKISLLQVDKNFNQTEKKKLLNTGSHLSYPFIFEENNRIFLFPEAGASGKLSCYEYDSVNKSLVFLQDIVELPLLDSTIIQYDNMYWLFGTQKGIDEDSKLYLYFSDKLTGPYTAHPKNPVKTGLTASRPAGNLIEVDGILYRPSQNSKYTYGGSITINKIRRLTEFDFDEEFYMSIEINSKNKFNKGMHAIHTLNSTGDVIVVDGTKWRFSPIIKLKQIRMKFNGINN